MRRSVSMTLAAALVATPLVLTTPSPVVAGDKTDGPTPVTLTRWTSDADFRAASARDSRCRADR